VISKDFDSGLVLADERRKFDVGTTQAVVLLIDARKPISAIAKVINAHGILILDALRHGKLLTIVAEGASASFRLTGTREAIAALAACVTRHRGIEMVELSTQAPA
jgi:hypothetical protein